MSIIDDTEEPCDLCAEPIECECDDPEYCSTCDGFGEYVPDHCCDCGGSPYCQCCSSCSAPNAGACSCTVTVTLLDGTVKALPAPDGELEPEFERDVHRDTDPEPPDDYYDEAPADASGPMSGAVGYSTEPPF
ncbi:hypothetical protein [Streptomyces abikoensis]|uniref:hypothetical protein n=1 Tax=Streptomyces abikoensis TaxID=97398 RepID=UPI00167A38F4|nr:hypothetical protein [Streptomyces abikoensis]GGP55816.1 hypothetical protein GCM10010214_31260 [Streptomyces abikoensis]